MNNGSEGATAIKVLKVRVPTKLHDRLHVARIMQGRPMAAIVREALEAYLARQDADADSPSEASAQA